jgi:hypothetical protein
MGKGGCGADEEDEENEGKVGTKENRLFPGV